MLGGRISQAWQLAASEGEDLLHEGGGKRALKAELTSDLLARGANSFAGRLLDQPDPLWRLNLDPGSSVALVADELKRAAIMEIHHEAAEHP